MIDSDYPFALIRYLDKNFSETVELKSGNALLKIRKQGWIKA